MVAWNPYDPKTAFLLGAGSSLLEAGGWSPMPVSMGQALGAGMRGGMASYRDAIAEKRARDRERLEEGFQRARTAQLQRQARQAEALETMIAGLPAEEQIAARADPQAYVKARYSPSAPKTRKRSLEGGMVQDEELVGGEWRPVGEPYSRREQIFAATGTDADGNPITTFFSRADLENQLGVSGGGGEAEVVQAGGAPEGPRRVTVTTGGRPDFSEGERKIAGFANRMVETGADIDRLMTGEGADYPVLTQALSDYGVPFTNYTLSEDEQQLVTAATEFTRAALRRESGAVIGADEIRDTIRTYFPQPGDKPGTVAYKNRLRNNLVRGTVAESGGAYESLFSGDTDRGDGGGGDTGADTQEAGTATPSGWDRKADLSKWSDDRILSTPQSSVLDMTEKQFNVFERRRRALTSGNP